VIPVVNPEGFLTAEELAMLDSSLPPNISPTEQPSETTDTTQ
jgi:hypothetical protein